MDIKTPWERKLCELSTEKEAVDAKVKELSLQRKTMLESLDETSKKLECVCVRVKEKADGKKILLDLINNLTQDLAYHKFQAKELKRGISENIDKIESCQNYRAYMGEVKRDRLISILSKDSSEESAVNYSFMRKLPKSGSLDGLRIELKAIDFEVEKIQERLTATRNDLFKIENDLKNELEVEKQLIKVTELLEKEKSELDAKLSSVEMEERVLDGYVARIKKNIKKTYNKLPPIAASQENGSN